MLLMSAIATSPVAASTATASGVVMWAAVAGRGGTGMAGDTWGSVAGDGVAAPGGHRMPVERAAPGGHHPDPGAGVAEVGDHRVPGGCPRHALGADAVLGGGDAVAGGPLAASGASDRVDVPGRHRLPLAPARRP